MRGSPIAFILQIQARRKKFRAGGFLFRKTDFHAGKAGREQELLQKRRGQDGEVFLAAEDEVFQSTPKAFPFDREVRKPGRISFHKFAHGVFPVGPTQPVDTAGLQAAEDITEMEVQIRKMFNDMMGVKGIDGAVMERKRVTKISPKIALTAEHVGIHINPARQIILLPWSELDLQGSRVTRRAERLVKKGVGFKERTGEPVESVLLAPGKHDEL